MTVIASTIFIPTCAFLLSCHWTWKRPSHSAHPISVGHTESSFQGVLAILPMSSPRIICSVRIKKDNKKGEILSPPDRFVFVREEAWGSWYSQFMDETLKHRHRVSFPSSCFSIRDLKPPKAHDRKAKQLKSERIISQFMNSLILCIQQNAYRKQSPIGQGFFFLCNQQFFW